MAPRKPKSVATAEVPVQTTKVTKSKPSTSSVKQLEKCKVKRYRNGLLNLEKTPTHLVAVAQSNADVPLLRLPAELRNRIWVFAMGGQQVILPSSPTQKGAAVRLPAVTHLRVTHLIVRTVRALRFSHPVSLAFRLPEVSRQIYSETVLTAYSENTFIYDTAHWTYRNATTRLMIAQRRAIVSIEPDPQTFSTMVLPSRHHGNVWRKRLPNVRTIFVTALALKNVQLAWNDSSYPFSAKRSRWSEEQWRSCLVQRLKEVGGDGIHVDFK